MKFKNWLFFNDLRETNINYIFEKNIITLDKIRLDKINIREKLENIIKTALLLENEEEELEDFEHTPEYLSGDEDAKPIEELEPDLEPTDKKQVENYRNLRDSMLNLRFFAMYLRGKNIKKLKQIRNNGEIINQNLTVQEKKEKYKKAFGSLVKLGYLKKEDSATPQEIEEKISIAIKEDGNEYPEARVENLVSKNSTIESLRSEVWENLAKIIQTDGELEYMFSQESDELMSGISDVIESLSKRTVYSNGKTEPWNWPNLINSEGMSEKQIQSLIINRIKGAASSDRLDDYRAKSRHAKTLGAGDDADEEMNLDKMAADKKSRNPSDIVADKEGERRTVFIKFKNILDEMKIKYPLNMLLWCVSSGVNCYSNLLMGIGNTNNLEKDDEPVDDIENISANPLFKDKSQELDAVWTQVLDQIERIPKSKLASIGIPSQEIVIISNWLEKRNSGNRTNSDYVQLEINRRITKMKKILMKAICAEPDIVNMAQSFGGELASITSDCL